MGNTNIDIAGGGPSMEYIEYPRIFNDIPFIGSRIFRIQA